MKEKLVTEEMRFLFTSQNYFEVFDEENDVSNHKTIISEDGYARFAEPKA